MKKLLGYIKAPTIVEDFSYSEAIAITQIKGSLLNLCDWKSRIYKYSNQN